MSNFKPKRVIILASGYSVKPEIDNGLWDKIKNEFVIGINFSFKWVETTSNFFGDWKFYQENKESIDKLPVVIAMDREKLKEYCPVQDNVYLIKRGDKYHGTESLRNGCFSSNLSGPFLLTCCIALGFEEIYLLGMDWGCTIKEGYTHWYQDEFTHKGVGYKEKLNGGKIRKVYNTNNYTTDANKYFKVYEEELKRIKIINVCPESNIETFPKISYQEFFKILEEDEQVVLQEPAREWLREKLDPYRTNK